jgi:hypothetical protein
MSLFKRAAARGVAHALVQRGVAEFPTKEAMDEASDAAADLMMGASPEVSGEGGHDPEELAALAEKIIAISDALKQEQGASEERKMASEYVKMAGARDLDTVAFEAATGVMVKAAEETASGGALVMGGDKGNKEEQSAQHDSVAKLDLKNRSSEEYTNSRGRTDLDTSAGEVGKLTTAPKSPGNSPEGVNSVNEDAKKSASLRAIRKLAADLILGKQPENKETAAAHHDGLAKLDLHHRPMGYAVVPKGGANFSEPQSARVGLEKKPDVMPKRGVTGTNSVTEASKAASDQELFVEIFRKTASDVGPYLPSSLSDDQKLAAIRDMMPLDRPERSAYLEALSKAAEEKSVSEMLEKMKGEKSEKMEAAHEKKESPAYEKKEEEHEGKKESALLSQIREMARSAATYR